MGFQSLWEMLEEAVFLMFRGLVFRLEGSGLEFQSRGFEDFGFRFSVQGLGQGVEGM